MISLLTEYSLSEFIPFIIGSIIILALIKWFFNRVDDRPITSPSLYFSYSPDPEVVRELQGMFPNIPRAYVIRELDRADGAIAKAIDNLLLMAADFVSDINDSLSNLSTTPMTRSSIHTHHNIINSLKSKGHESHESEIESEIEIDTVGLELIKSGGLTKKNWDSVDSKTRHRIILERKKSMLVKARESFLESQSERFELINKKE